MRDLVFTDKQGRPTVNARDLHANMGVRRDFSTWIKRYLGDFKKGRDYTEFSPETGKMGRPVIEYHLSLDTAKHIAMQQRTEAGFAMREYFIKVEKKYHAWAIDRARSKAVRREFTDMLQEHGYKGQHEYRHTTIEMKIQLGLGNRPKDALSRSELRRLMAAELLSTNEIEEDELYGFSEVHPACVESARGVRGLIEEVRNA